MAPARGGGVSVADFRFRGNSAANKLRNYHDHGQTAVAPGQPGRNGHARAWRESGDRTRGARDVNIALFVSLISVRKVRIPVQHHSFGITALALAFRSESPAARSCRARVPQARGR